MKKDLLIAASAWFPKPVRHYTFEPNTVNVNVLTDLSGTQNGTIIGSPVFTTGQRGSCVKFDGNIANYINIGQTDFIQQTAIFSIAFWAKTQYADADTLMALAGSSFRRVNIGWSLGFDDRSSVSFNRVLRFSIYGGTNTDSIIDLFVNNIVPADSVYHHYVVTGDGVTIRAYIDGSLIGSAPIIRTLQPNLTAASSCLGCSNYATASGVGFPYNGEIDEFRIMPKSLTENQIKRLYQNGQ